MRAKTTAIGTTLLVLTSLIPFSPADMTFLYAAQSECGPRTETIVTGTTTITKEREYWVDCPTGEKYSFAAFQDQVGNVVYVQIDNRLYQRLTERGGRLLNPERTEYRSLFELLARNAEAAIARHAASAVLSATAVSSVTFAIDAPTSNGMLFVSVFRFGSQTVSSVTYNSDPLTQMGNAVFNASNAALTYAMVAPDSGTNNVTITMSASTDFDYQATTYSGATSTLPTGSAITTEVHTSAVAVPNDMAPTSVADDSWAYTTVRNVDRANADGTNFVQINGAASVTAADSNAGMGTAGLEVVNIDAAAASRMMAVTTAFAPAVIIPDVMGPQLRINNGTLKIDNSKVLVD